MVGSLNKLPIAVSGMMFFDTVITVGGVLGVVIAFVAGLLYSYGKSIQSTTPVLPKYAPLSKADDDGVVAEDPKRQK